MNIFRKLRTAYSIARKSPKGWHSYVWNTAMSQLGVTWPLLPPVHVGIEPTNLCNAKCPVCETGRGELERPRGMLALDDFSRFLDRSAATTNSLLFYFMGETFLNKNAYEMIRLARNKDIFVETCTNGDVVDPQGIIYSDINKISFQFGGMTQETHQRYRVNSDLAKGRENLLALIEERKRHPGSNVQIEAGFIVMRHNEHEIESFITWAKEIGADHVNIIAPCVRNMTEGYAYLPKDPKYWFYDREAFQQGVLRPQQVPHNSCPWIWNSIQINWDGTAVPCCRDPHGRHILGNVFEEGLGRVFNNENARRFRKAVLNNQEKLAICKLCSGFGMPQVFREKPETFSIEEHGTHCPETTRQD